MVSSNCRPAHQQQHVFQVDKIAGCVAYAALPIRRGITLCKPSLLAATCRPCRRSSRQTQVYDKLAINKSQIDALRTPRQQLCSALFSHISYTLHPFSTAAECHEHELTLIGSGV